MQKTAKQASQIRLNIIVLKCCRFYVQYASDGLYKAHGDAI